MSSSPTEIAAALRRRDHAPDGGVGGRGHGRRLARRGRRPVEAEQTICEISTDKIDTEVPAPVERRGGRDPGRRRADGRRRRRAGADRHRRRGRRRQPAAVRRRSRHRRSRRGRHPAAAPAPAPSAPRPAAAVLPRRPADRRRARDRPVDASSGTGRDGRVRKQDVLALVNGKRRTSPAVEEPPLHIESPYRPDPPAAHGARAARAHPRRGSRRPTAAGCRGCAVRSAST